MSWVASVTALILSIMNQPVVYRVLILIRTSGAGLCASDLSPPIVLGAGLERGVPTATTRGELVQGFDSNREADGGVNVPLRHMEARTVGNQGHADQQQKAQCQHLHRGVPVDEIGERPRSGQHYEDGDNDRYRHYPELVGHP